MDERSGEHPGDDLGVLMRMIGIAGPCAYQIVIVDQQRPKGDVAGIVMLAEGEAVVSFGPVGPREETQPRSTHLNAGRLDPRRAHWFSIPACGRLNSWHRRTLSSCLPVPSPSPLRPGRNQSGTIPGRQRYEPVTKRSL